MSTNDTPTPARPSVSWRQVLPAAVVALILGLLVGLPRGGPLPAAPSQAAPTAAVLPTAAAAPPAPTEAPAQVAPPPTATALPPTATAEPTADPASNYLQPIPATAAPPPPAPASRPAQAAPPPPPVVEAPENTPAPLMPIWTPTPAYTNEAPDWVPPLASGVDPNAPTSVPLVVAPDQVPAYQGVKP
jgi:hypothetical protein